MRRLFRVTLTLVVLAAIGAGVFFLAVRRTKLPNGITQPPAYTPVLVDVRGRPISVLAHGEARECYPIKLHEMGKWLPMATVGIEDHRFWEHGGMDVQALTGATLRNLKNRRVIGGASTITQQLIKLSMGIPPRTFREKVHEALAAVKLEESTSKKEILELYMNRLDYGNRRVGSEAAARAYFGKSAGDLSLAEAIYLAGLPQSPARLNPWSKPEAAMARYRRNVQWLEKLALLPDGATAEELLKHPPVVGRHDAVDLAYAFTSMLKDRAPAPTKKTSLDLDLQAMAQRALWAHLEVNASNGVRDAAVVIIDNATGEVRAMACGGDQLHSAINSAMEPRSCGSTLKPLLYLRAIEQRKLTAASLLPDTQEAVTEAYSDYDPQNYSQHYRGPVRVREALGNSLNVPAVVTLNQLGARDTFDYLRAWGLDFPKGFDAYGAGFILGNAPVRLVELAEAYAGLERGGLAWKARLTPHDTVESRRMASPEASSIVTDILCDNRARTASFGNNSPLNRSQRTAVKTGTSSGFRDGWCVGFNKTHTVAVWAGNLDGTPMRELLSVRSAAPLWAGIMEMLYAMGDEPLEEPRESEKLKPVEVAAETGLLPREGEMKLREWFLAGTEPTENAASMYVDGELQLPPGYAGWCASPQNRLGAVVASKDLRILFPKDGATFAINDTLPKGQQMLPLKSSRSGCVWYLNGEKLTEPMVPLKRGQWSLSAQVGGETATARYLVQ
ncbi:hypothetical protein BH09VER1_BH09VER1_00650 [soil metagenome]